MMSNQMTECSSILKLLFEENYDDSNSNVFENASSEDIKHFMMALSTIIVKDLNDKAKVKILKMISVMMKYHQNEVINNLRLAYTNIGKILISSHNSVNSSSGFGSSSHFGIQIITQVLLKSPKEKNDCYKNLLQLVLLLPSGCLLSGKSKIINSCKRIIKGFLNDSFFSEQILNIINLSDPKVPFMGFISIMCDNCPIKSKLNKEKLVSYVNLCFSDKHVVPIDILKMLKPLIEQTIQNKSEFNEHLLPIFQKMTLRSPEKYLWIIKIILDQISKIDLSSTSADLAKVFSLQLQSKSEQLRIDAKDCLLRVVCQSSETDSIKTIVQQLEKILNQVGSEKISSVDIRQHVWYTFTEIPSYVSVGSTESSEKVAEFALTTIMNLITKESQEPVIIQALDSIAKWSKLSANQVPASLITWFKNNVFNPKLSSSIRVHYFSCLNYCFDRVEKLSALKVLLPQLEDLLEKSLKVSSSTVAFVHEMIPIIELVIRYFIRVENASTDFEFWKSSSTTPSLFTLSWNYLGFKQNINQVKLLSDSMMLSASKSGLKFLISIISHVLINFYDVVIKQPEHKLAMIRCLVVCSMHHDYENVRKPTLDIVTQLARNINGEEIVSEILNSIYSLNLSSPASVISSCFWPVDTNLESPTSISIYDVNSLTPLLQRIVELIDAVLKIENAPSMFSEKLSVHKISTSSRFPTWWDDDARIRIMNQALLSINQHMITHFSLDLWAKHAQNLLDSTDQIVSFAGQDIIDRLTGLTSLNPNDLAVVACLCRNFSDDFIDKIISAVIMELNSNTLFECKQSEVGIMNTRDGYLYNKILLDSLPKYETQKGNIKRENKLYSYKEQMAEIEIRKELEKKKQEKQKNIQEADICNDNPLTNLANQLTKNQMEQVNAELEKEKRIRSKTKLLENRANIMCDILEHMVSFRKSSFLNHFDRVLTVLHRLVIGSPVARVRAALLLNEFRSLTNLSQRQAIWVLRIVLLDSSICGPEFTEHWTHNENGRKLFELIEPWMTEELGKSSADLIESIHRQVAQKKYLGFSTFLYLIPGLCRLCQSVADMECQDLEPTSSESPWWIYLTWMNIDLLQAALAIVRHQLGACDISIEQLFNTELLQVLTGVIQTSEIPDVQTSIEQNVRLMMNLLHDLHHTVSPASLHSVYCRVFDTVLNCFVSDTVRARLLALQCLDTIGEFGNQPEFRTRMSLHLWIATHDVNSLVAEKALELWNRLRLPAVEPEIVLELEQFVILPLDSIMSGAISGITALIELFPDQLEPLIINILQRYDELAYLRPPVCDAFGRVLEPSPPDQWRARYGLGKTLLALARFIRSVELVEHLFRFLIPKALNDRNEQVRVTMRATGQQVIALCCGPEDNSHINVLLPIMENYMLEADNDAEHDIIRQSIVILMGSLARHLDATDPRFSSIFGKLIAALNFPSADVQRAVSDTFDPLIKAFDEDQQREMCNKLVRVLLDSEVEAERKGAAFGLAGIIKAVGITKLKSFKIHDALIDAIQNKQNERHREIALFTFEQISAKMNKMFEPYVPGILKYLQDAFADPSNNVRQTADRTAKMLMSNLSAPGVKIVLNPLLAGLDTNQWRTKAVSVELLGSMAYCAPKQLSNCLPTIVPKILGILSDSHPNVIKAGRQALREIGSVIHNKEVQAIVSVLIDALCEPNKKTNDGLNALIDTKFIHQVDAASLALIMSMVARAFKERKSETKRKAAQIIGNLHSLTDDKDLQPYCSNLLPGLKGCLVDPDPGVRTVASKALGTIAKVMTSSVYEELMLWLMETLKDESSGVNRSGAAQGLSEVLLQKGIDHLDQFMPDILENSRNQKLLAHVRDGYLMLYIYLPKLFQEQFASYVEQILPPILQALSDEVEFIRETALNAGQGIIDIYSHIAIDTMLPNLELGMLDSNWRIRYSSIRLLGDLLFRLTGISGKGTTSGGSEDESFAQSDSQDLLIASLGQDTYNRVLAKIYISRMDVALLVKQTATHIWKLMVVNNARSLRLILKDLMAIILDCLSDDNEDCRVMSTKTLGEVVKKLGERILPDIFDHLETGFVTCISGQRIGICTAISEILKASPKDQIGNYLDKILPTFNYCMIDQDENVRQMAGEIFELLNSSIGTKIVEIIIPDLVDKLEDPIESDNALNGLCTLVSFKGRIVIPSLIPKLTYPTVNTKAFSKLATVAGDILSRHIVSVLPALMQAVSNVIGQPSEQGEVDNCCQVVLAMSDQQVTQIILKDLNSAITSPRSANEQLAALYIMSGYIRGSQNVSENRALLGFVPIIIRSVGKLFVSENRTVLLAAFDCMTYVISSLGPNNIEYVKDIRDAVVMVIREKSLGCGSGVAATSAEEVLIPAFCLPERGIGPFIELYREALVNGRVELKEVAAGAIEDCITVTETEVLAKSAVKIAGPLIRTMAERHSAPTRASIVASLGKLIVKCPAQVKLFATQMQTIFIKCLADPSQPLRHRTAIAQAQLAVIISKPDQFFTDFAVREFSDENQYRITGMEAVRFSLESAGHRMSRDALLGLLEIFRATIGDKDDQVRVLGAACLGLGVALLAFPDIVMLLPIIDCGKSSVLGAHSVAVTLITLLKSGSAKIFAPECPKEVTNAVVKTLAELCSSDKVFISSTSYRALGFALSYLIADGNVDMVTELLALLQQGMKNSAMEIKELVIDICGYLSWTDREGANVAMYAKPVLAVLINGYRAKENQLRINSEKRIMDLVHMSVALRKRPSASNGGATGPADMDETVYKKCCDSVEQGTRSALQEVVVRFKKTILSGSTKECPTQCPTLDNTYNKIINE